MKCVDWNSARFEPRRSLTFCVVQVHDSKSNHSPCTQGWGGATCFTLNQVWLKYSLIDHKSLMSLSEEFSAVRLTRWVQYDGYIRHQNDQWSYDGYFGDGWVTSCGRWWDSATPKCCWRGSQGMIFVQSSKISLFFPGLCPFRRVFFVSHSFVRFGVQTFERWGVWFRRFLEASFETLLGQRACFCELRLWPWVFFLKITFIFSKQSRRYLPDSYGRSQDEQIILVMVRWKTDWKFPFRALARSSAEEPSIVVAIGTSCLRWPMDQ